MHLFAKDLWKPLCDISICLFVVGIWTHIYKYKQKTNNGLLVLELQVIVSHLILVFENELRIFESAHRTIFPFHFNVLELNLLFPPFCVILTVIYQT